MGKISSAIELGTTGPANEEEPTRMTATDYLLILKRYWIPIAVLTFLGGMLGYGVAQVLPKEYRSTASVLVVPSASSADFGQSSNYVQNVVESYAVLATTPKVLDPVIRQLGLSTSASSLAKSITVEAPLNTAVLNISTIDTDPWRAQQISAGVSSSLIAAVADLAPQLRGKPVIRVETITGATLPQAPVSPRTRLVAALGALAGLVLTVLWALSRRMFNRRVGSAEDLGEAARAPVLGEVPMTSKQESVSSAVLASPRGQVAEALRGVSATLRFMAVDKPVEVVLVTSAEANEGKTSVALGLALVMAESGRSVLLMEADIRRPTIARMTGLEGSLGLTNVLVGDCRLDEAAQPWGHPGLRVLTSGEEAPNPGQLIASGRLESIVRSVREEYGYVVIDSPPVLSVSDPLWLAPATDGVVLVARSGKPTVKTIRQTVESLEATHSDVLGCVLNGVRAKSRGVYYGTDLNHREEGSVEKLDA